MIFKKWCLGLIIVLALLACDKLTDAQKPPPPPPAYSKELESSLRQTLFDGYETMQRPSKKVAVHSALSLLSLNSLDIKEQTMSITGYFHFVWRDSRLQWSNMANYSNIKFLFTTENYVWTPAIIIENAVDNIDVISKPNVPIRLISLGLLIWLPSDIFTTSCESDITYWPLDTQKCELIISSWGYTANEVELMFNDDALVKTFYQENGEWELINTTSSSVVTEREKETFSRLIFTMVFRRRPIFHMLNTLFPVVLMGFLTVIIFKLNPESGERVGLALTILLAYAVYLGLISESIPQTSLSASLLSTYLASILLLQTVAVFLTVLYLDIYFRSVKKPVPGWVQTVASSCLSKLACVDCHCSSAKVSPTQKEDSFASNPDTYHTKNKNIMPTQNVWLSDADVSNDVTDDGLIVDNEENEGTPHEYSWKEIALMLDKLTMYIYFVLVCLFTGVTFGVMTANYSRPYS